MNKYLKTLEFDKILEMLVDLTSNDETRRMALEIRPNSDLSTVRHENLKTNQALNLSIQYGTPPFTSFKDISVAAKRVKIGAVISLYELMDIAVMLRQISNLAKWYSACKNVETELDYLFAQLKPNDELLEKLERSITSDIELSDAASHKLATIRLKISRAEMHLRKSLDKMINDKTTQQYLQEFNVTIRNGRFVLPVKTEYRSKVLGLVHDISSTGQTIFIEPMTSIEINNNLRILQSEEHEEIARIIQELCHECSEYSDILCNNYKICAELNLYFAKSNLAAQLKCSMPKINDDGNIYLNKARHPLLNNKKVVPINLSLGFDYHALIITGTNTGGKTVALKTVGLLTVMTMCGLLIPVSNGSSISVFKNILVDIGDSQSIENNLSTFSSHIKKTIEILEIADERSLVLLDELGSGTDPVEGAALAVSIVSRLITRGVKLIVTTHYHELKAFAIDNINVENASCEFDIDTLHPTYHLIIGSPGKSNAFVISESLGMPTDIIEEAKARICDNNKIFEESIEKLETARIELESQRAEVARLKLQLAEYEKTLSDEYDKLKNDRIYELEIARLQAMSIIEKTKTESNIIFDELDQLRKEKKSKDFSNRVCIMKSRLKQSLNKMYDIANPINKCDTKNYVLPRKLKIGDIVYVIDFQRIGIIYDAPEGSKFVFVQMGSIKTKVNISRLRLNVTTTNMSVHMNNNKEGKIEVKFERQGKMEIDIRGCACDDGIYRLDSFIDQAVMSNISTICIIHGKGTGVLRLAVHKYLKNHPNIKNFRLGKFGEGEDGVTISELN